MGATCITSTSRTKRYGKTGVQSRLSLMSVIIDYEKSPFFLRKTRANETRARKKFPTRERAVAFRSLYYP